MSRALPSSITVHSVPWRLHVKSDNGRQAGLCRGTQYLHFCVHFCSISFVRDLLTSLDNMRWNWSSVSKQRVQVAKWGSSRTFKEWYWCGVLVYLHWSKDVFFLFLDLKKLSGCLVFAGEFVVCGSGCCWHFADLHLTVLSISFAVLCLTVCCEVAKECVQ